MEKVITTQLISQKEALKDALSELSLKDFFKAIRPILHLDAPLYNDVSLLKSRYKAIDRRENIAGELSFEDAQRAKNRIRAALLNVIDELQESDFKSTAVFTNGKGFKYSNGSTKSDPSSKGSILYRIPSIMPINRPQKCIIRVAFDKKYLRNRQIEEKDTTEDNRSISELLEIQLQDPLQRKIFDIKSVTDTEQFLDREDFTEWIFYATPKEKGLFELMFKITLTEERKGKEVKRNILLEKKVEIVTEDLPLKKIQLGEKERNKALAAVAAAPLLTIDGFEIANEVLNFEPLPLPPPPPPDPLAVITTISGILLIGFIIYLLWGEKPQKFFADPPILGYEEVIDDLNIRIRGKTAPYQLTIKNGNLIKWQEEISSNPKGELTALSLSLIDYNHLESGDLLHVKDKYDKKDSVVLQLVPVDAPTIQYEIEGSHLKVEVSGAFEPFDIIVNDSLSKKYASNSKLAGAHLIEHFKYNIHSGDQLLVSNRRRKTSILPLELPDRLSFTAKLIGGNLKIDIENGTRPYQFKIEKNQKIAYQSELLKGTHKMRIGQFQEKTTTFLTLLLSDKYGQEAKREVVLSPKEFDNLDIVPPKTPDPKIISTFYDRYSPKLPITGYGVQGLVLSNKKTLQDLIMKIERIDPIAPIIKGTVLFDNSINHYTLLFGPFLTEEAASDFLEKIPKKYGKEFSGLMKDAFVKKLSTH